MTRPTRRRGHLALGGLLLALGCGPRVESVADYEVKIAVRRYNEALPIAYARADAGLLTQAATPDEMRRVEDLIGFLAQGRMVMDARQEAFEAGRVAHESETSATVEATEIWWYRHWVPQTGEVRQGPRRVRYRNRYHCLRAGSHWRVDRLEETGFEVLPGPVPAS